MYCQLQGLFSFAKSVCSFKWWRALMQSNTCCKGAYECVNVSLSKSSQRGSTQRNNGDRRTAWPTSLQSALGIITSHGNLLVGMNLENGPWFLFNTPDIKDVCLLLFFVSFAKVLVGLQQCCFLRKLNIISHTPGTTESLDTLIDLWANSLDTPRCAAGWMAAGGALGWYSKFFNRWSNFTGGTDKDKAVKAETKSWFLGFSHLYWIIRTGVITQPLQSFNFLDAFGP